MASREHSDDDGLRAENEELRRRVDELQRKLDERDRAPAEARARLLEAILDDAPLAIYVKDAEGRYLLMNRHGLETTGRTWEQVAGKTDDDLFPAELARSYREFEEALLTGAERVERRDDYPLQDGIHHFLTTKTLLREGGQVRGVCSFSTDITSFQRAELENRQLQDRIIRVQEENLRALSTPLLPIAEDVLLMPLIGHVDRPRAERVLEALLEGIVAQGAEFVILDVTGVPMADTDVTGALLKTARAVKLLGATVILTGIQPTIAQALVDIGADLGGIVTRGTLESGIAYALARRRGATRREADVSTSAARSRG